MSKIKKVSNNWLTILIGACFSEDKADLASIIKANYPTSNRFHKGILIWS